MSGGKNVVAVAPPPAKITVVDSKGPADFVQFGLFDGAFDPPALLLNSDSDEKDNFVGSDSRRFFVRIEDPSKKVPSAKKKREIAALFRTYYDDKKTVHDDGGADPSIVLVETTPGSGLFESSWLMLASDLWEIKNVKTTTGRAGLGLKPHGDKDYRLRLASMFGYAGFEYPPKSGSVAHVPVFRRSPDDRRNMPLQIFVLEPLFNPAFTTYVLTKDLENIRIVYARLGLWPWTAVDAAHEKRAGVKKVAIGKDSLLVVPVPPGIANPAAMTDVELETLGREYPGLLASGASGKPPPGPSIHCETDTLRLFYVPGLASTALGPPNGVTFADLTFWASPARGASFIADAGAKVSSGMGSSAAHELGHTLTNHPKGHFLSAREK